MAVHIQIDDITPRVTYEVGGTSQSAFDVPFAFFADADLDVYVGGTLKTLSTDYTVAGAGTFGVGERTVTLTTAVTNTTVMIVRDIPIKRTTDFPNSGPLQTNSLNTDLDKAIAIQQQLEDGLGRAVRLADEDPTADLTLPVAADRKSKLFGFDADGDVIAVLGPTFSDGTFVGAAEVATRADALVTSFAASVSALRTGGYATAGDGGGALYRRAASEPSHAGKFQSADGAWWELVEAVVRPEMFGGVAGAADSTTAIQNALDYSLAKTVLVPEGTWIASTTTVSRNVLIRGQSESSILKQKASTSGNLISVGTAGIDLAVRDLVMDGNNTGQTANSANYIIGSINKAGSGMTDPLRVDVENVTFKNQCGGSVVIQGDNVNANLEMVRVHNCRFFGGNEGDASMYAPRYVGVHDAINASVTDCHFDFGSTPAGHGASAIVIAQTQTTTAYFSRLTVTGNTFRRLGREASNTLGVIDFYIWGSGIIVANNRFEECWAQAIKGKASSQFVVVEGNTINGVTNSRDGISINASSTPENYDQFRVSGNHLYSIGGIGIVVDGASGNEPHDYVISGNTIESASSHGISVNNCANGVVEGNIVSDVTGVGIRLNACTGAWSVNDNILATTGNIGIYTLGASSGLIFNASNNTIVSASGRSIYITEAYSASIQGNTIKDVTNNGAQQAIFVGTVTSATVRNNIAVGSYGTAFAKGTITNLYEHGNTWNGRVQYASAAPTSGSYSVGDLVFASAPVAGGKIGWVCTTAGSPGTWKLWGSIDA